VNLFHRTLEQSWQNAQKQPPGEYLLLVQDYHSIAAGLKAWLGWWGAEALETVRRSIQFFSFLSSITSFKKGTEQY
jgi:hypothetical protein